MEIHEVLCKTALSESTLPGLTYSLNPYRGCQHNCAYCYAPNVLRVPREQWGECVEVKTNIPIVLAKELNVKKTGIVGISTVTDPYQPLERTYSLTRRCLEQLVTSDFPAHIQTKSALVTRDIDLLCRFSDTQVMMSIGTLNDEERRMLEPLTSPIPERLEALQKLSNAGVKTAVFFGPIYPTMTLDAIPTVLAHFKEIGASEIWVDRLNLKPGIWENLEKKLRQNSETKQKFFYNMFQNKKYYQEMRAEIHRQGKEQNLQIIDAF
jgi:DNA repair photolyase